MTSQLLLSKPLKSVEMVTREVLIMAISAVARKMQMQRLYPADGCMLAGDLYRWRPRAQLTLCTRESDESH